MANEPWKPNYKLETPEGRLAHAQNCQALQMLERGECPPHLQKRALEFIVYNLCGTYNLEFRPDSERATTFASGMRHVGLQLVTMMKMNVDALLRDKRPASEQG